MIKIFDIEYIEDIKTVVVTLENNRTVQVQFEREANRLHADYYTYFAHIDHCSNYSYDLNEEEEEEFNEWIKTCETIQNVIKELDQLN